MGVEGVIAALRKDVQADALQAVFDSTAAVIEDGANRKTRTVSVSCTPLGPQRVEALGRLLILNKHLRHLTLSAVDMGTTGAVDLFHCLRKNTALEQLDVSGNFIGPGAVEAICGVVEKHPLLNSLNLAFNPLTDMLAVSLGVALVSSGNNTLVFLNLRGTDMTDVGLSELKDAIATPACKVNTLWFNMNTISEDLQRQMLELLRSKAPPRPEEAGKKKKKG